jgi:CheY-like chemotaxis protein
VLGAEVALAHSGRQALDCVDTFTPDVVLLDIGMPGMDGYEVARRIRANPANRHISLIALTGWGQDEDRRRSVAAASITISSSQPTSSSSGNCSRSRKTLPFVVHTVHIVHIGHPVHLGMSLDS